MRTENILHGSYSSQINCSLVTPTLHGFTEYLLPITTSFPHHHLCRKLASPCISSFFYQQHWLSLVEGYFGYCQECSWVPRNVITHNMSWGEESILGNIDHSRSWKNLRSSLHFRIFLKILKLFKKYSTTITVIICLCSLHERDKIKFKSTNSSVIE